MAVRSEITRLEEKIEGADQRLGSKIDEVDKRLSSKIDAVDDKLSFKIDELDKRLDVTQRLTVVEEQLKDLRTKA